MSRKDMIEVPIRKGGTAHIVPGNKRVAALIKSGIDIDKIVLDICKMIDEGFSFNYSVRKVFPFSKEDNMVLCQMYPKLDKMRILAGARSKSNRGLLPETKREIFKKHIDKHTKQGEDL